MKCLFLVAVPLLLVQALDLTDEQLDKIKQVHDSCLKETGVDLALVEKALSGEFTDDPKLKAQFLCTHTKFGTIDGSGNILEDRAVELLMKKFPQEEIVKTCVKQCITKKDTPQETVYEFTKCLRSLAPKDFDMKAFGL